MKILRAAIRGGAKECIDIIISLIIYFKTMEDIE
jgi:hypothetical protein